MKGFICDRCGKTENGYPDNIIRPEIDIPELKQFAYLEFKLVGGLPSPDLCRECQLEIAKKIIKAAKK